MSHQPGPWKAVAMGANSTGESVMCIRSSDHRGVAEYLLPDDARLIAAAPEMLEALKAAWSHLSLLYPTGAEQGDYVCKSVKDAIAQATGENP